jgi:hypothetical protein
LLGLRLLPAGRSSSDKRKCSLPGVTEHQPIPMASDDTPTPVKGAPWEDVTRCALLGFMPTSACLGRYGGGAEMLQSRQLLNRWLPPSRIPDTLKMRIKDSVIAALTAYVSERDPVAKISVPRSGGVPRFVATLFASLDWSLTLQVSSSVYGNPDGRMNIMTQGYLYGSFVETALPARLGASKVCDSSLPLTPSHVLPLLLVIGVQLCFSFAVAPHRTV